MRFGGKTLAEILEDSEFKFSDFASYIPLQKRNRREPDQDDLSGYF